MSRSSCCSEQMREMERLNLSSEDVRESSCSSKEGGSVQPRFERMAANLNVSKSTNIHVGVRYVSVTQNIEQTEVVEDLPFYRYIYHIARSTTKSERFIFIATICVLVICIVLIAYFAVKATNVKEDTIGTEPADWTITRDKWLARKYNITEKLDGHIPLVVVSHTVSPGCYTYKDCVAAVRNVQRYFLDNLGYDIPYNFLIGNDGRVYQGLGWDIVGAHTYGYNFCSVGLAFIGDYREGLPSYNNVTELQQQRAHMLFEEGVKQGHLHTNFRVVGARDIRPTLSPGANLYKAIQGWPSYDHKNMFKGHTCSQILKLFENESVIGTTTISVNKSLI